MSISPARIAAFDILLRVNRTAAFADELLHSAQWQKLSSVDHGLATELVMGVLRWRSWLDLRISEHASQSLEKLDAEILTALRLAAYQLQFLTRIPERAAVHESVELVKRARKRSAAGFVNAVLRKLASRPREALSSADPKSPAQLAEGSAHPLWLVERWNHEFGLEVTKKICDYDQQIPETAIRVTSADAESLLSQRGVQFAPGRLLASARRLRTGDLAKTSAFHTCDFAVQDEGSQLIALLAGRGERILDCCAAPGGKTRVMAQQNPGSTVTAIELHSHRAELLRTLVPNANVEVVQADVCDWTASRQFDRVLADVPCSGTGTLAHNPEIKWRLAPSDLAELQSRQLKILRAGLQHLAPGGRLVYSTCSLEKEENQAVVEQALASDTCFQLRDCRAELERLKKEGELVWSDLASLLNRPYLRTIPGIHPCDGFFAAIIARS
jgi:16S rRNA (cytosine967-C5)-methyltransferase